MPTNDFSTTQFEQVRRHVQTALEAALRDGSSAATIEALRASLDLLPGDISPLRLVSTARHAGTIDYTLEDDECPPHGRQVDVRVYYGWDDYDPADEPFPMWGARIEGFEVLAVRYLDPDGNTVDLGTHHGQLAAELLERQTEQVTEACTDDGVRRGVGEAHPLHRPSPASGSLASENIRRMAPSERTRQSPPQRRKMG